MAEKLRRLWALLTAVVARRGMLDVTILPTHAPASVHLLTRRVIPQLAGADGEGDGGEGGEGEGGEGDGGEGGEDGEPDWKSQSRKHEGRAKSEKKRAEKLEAEIAELKKSNQTDQEKAIEEARKAARDEALSEAQNERRSDRLEVAVTRLAAKGITVGDKTVRFADPEDALVNIERAISRGDADDDDIFDSEGKVQTDALMSALKELLERKPHLAADGAVVRLSGDADAGKGSGAGDSDSEDMNDLIRRKARS